jgi:plastocyanin
MWRGLNSTRSSAALMAAVALAAVACETDQEHLNLEPGGGPQTIEATAVDYAFEGVPETTAVGSGMTFRNTSDVEAHQLLLVDLPASEDRPVSELAQLSPGELEPLLDHVVGVSLATPGEGGRVASGELTLDEPGRYALLCLVPTGADPDEFMQAGQDHGPLPGVEGGPPHTTHGMYAEVTVED